MSEIKASIDNQSVERQDVAVSADPTKTNEDFADAAVWREISQVESTPAFCTAWLRLQVSLIEGTNRGVVVLKDPHTGELSPQAYWPEDNCGTPELVAVCDAAISEKRGVFRTGKKTTLQGRITSDVVGLPILINEQPFGVVAFEVAQRTPAAMGMVMRHIQWGTAWLETWIRRAQFANRNQVDSVLDIVGTCLEHEKFRAAAMSAATELATTLNCDRVSIGFRRGAHTTVSALSHSAEFESKSNLVRALGAAMDESIDQQSVVVFPETVGAVAQVLQAHNELARLHGVGAICTVPLTEGSNIVGGITLERPSDSPFEPEDVDLCRHVATLIGPILETKRRDDSWLIQKAAAALTDFLHRLFGPRHLGLKLFIFLLLAITVFFTVAEGTYQIKADATLEGTIERAVTAPIDGYILESHARAGDVVQAGDVMASLDEKELRLERLRWVSQKEQREREYSKALAEGDRAEVRILGAQIAQADAQLELIDEQLDRIRIVAPFDGVVVSGDLSQSLSAPVARGDILFEVAPLNGYRVALRVDEREITQLNEGQGGRLALASLTNDPLEFTVTKITPVSIAEEGRNYFRVEGRLAEMNSSLRPGMEGVGKIEIGTQKLIWIYTHKLIQSIRMRIWSWST